MGVSILEYFFTNLQTFMVSSVSEPITLLVTASRHAVHLSGKSTQCESLIENRHWGWVTLSDSRQHLLHCTPGAAELATFFRSSAKPFQALPLIESGAAAELALDELALVCASHTASERHVAVVQKILKKAGLSESDLQCGPHAPIDELARKSMREAGQKPGAIHNNCSGKHAGMLLYCQKHHLETQTYLQPDHPFQQKVLEGLRRFSGIQDIPLAVDGCGAPVFYLPLTAMATLYAKLGTEPVFEPIRQAMSKYPELIGGEGKVDTVLMQASNGELLAKVGADGVMCVSHITKGQGLALKMADGSNEVRNLAIMEILHQLGWLNETAWNDNRLKPYQQLFRTNTQDKVIGSYEIHFEPEQLQLVQ
jgi:L-asparaginase II